MGCQIVIRITPQGVQSPEIHTTSEDEENAAKEMLERIRPCLDVADAIIRKTNPGPRG